MKIIIMFGIFIITLGCSFQTTNNNSLNQRKECLFLNIYNVDTLKILLNKTIVEIKNFRYPDGVLLKDTLFESDEELQWNGVTFYKHSRKLFVVEASWENKNIVKRITLFSGEVQGLKSIKVGAKFKDIKSKLSRTIPSYPDGYFGLKLIGNNRITCFFDVSDYPNLSLGNVTFETIPNNLEVEEILIE
jgi:hypothetical protein